MDRDPKHLLEVKKNMRTIQSNIQRLYSITSALYEEIQQIKHFVNFKHDEEVINNLNVNQKNQNQKNNFSYHNSVLDNVEEFSESLSSSTQNGRKLKIINN
jgi:uncharacterized protein YoxC